MISVIIPAFNEEKTIEFVINKVKECKHVSEIIVVADGSTDDTRTVVSKLNVTCVSHDVNQGKGAAMLTGANAAVNENLLFLDADVSSFTVEDITAMSELLLGGVDYVKTHFKRDGGRVTQLLARPLLKKLFPEIYNKFPEPLSGQIGLKKKVLETITLEKDYGVDVGLLIDAWNNKLIIEPLEISYLKHRHHDLYALSLMSEQVMNSIFKRVNL